MANCTALGHTIGILSALVKNQKKLESHTLKKMNGNLIRIYRFCFFRFLTTNPTIIIPNRASAHGNGAAVLCEVVIPAEDVVNTDAGDIGLVIAQSEVTLKSAIFSAVMTFTGTYKFSSPQPLLDAQT